MVVHSAFICTATAITLDHWPPLPNPAPERCLEMQGTHPKSGVKWLTPWGVEGGEIESHEVCGGKAYMGVCERVWAKSHIRV